MSYQPGPYQQPPGSATPYGAPQPGYGYAQAGYGYQQPSMANLPAYAQPLVSIGSIIVTETEVITPSGRIPLAQANFGFINQTMLVRKTPQWAIVMAIVGFFVLTFFSLLFLLAKEDALTGHVMVTVSGAGVQHQEYLLITQPWQLNDLHARVQYAQGLAQTGWA